MDASEHPDDVVPFPDLTGQDANATIAADPVTVGLLALARSVAQTPSTVLLTGESGVGKEVIARYIHKQSDRADEEFVAVNCAALPPTLLESELFGHEKGAFSGAVKRHMGLFERAGKGTILLDEISEMSTDLQAKLLRVLQERVMYRVGGTEQVKLDVRVIATSNRDLRASVENGEFRGDLYYRLSVFPIQIPALRERPADIEALVLFYLPRFARQFGRPLAGIKKDALERLKKHAYPGNVRELKNALERAVILALNTKYIDNTNIVLDTAVDAASYQHSREPSAHRSSVRFVPGAEPLTEVRMRVILKTLEKFDGNRTRTAEALGVSLRTIRNKIRHYKDRGVEVPEP